MRFPTSRIILTSAFLSLTASLAFALAPQSTPPKTPVAKPPATKPATAPAPVVVAVKKTDGTTVRGTLVSADPDNVTVRSGGPKVEPVAIPWTDIASVSNGLTR